MSFDKLRKHNSFSLQRLIRLGKIVYACDIRSSWRLDWKNCDWDEYWKGCVVSSEIFERLNVFRIAYEKFIRGIFNPNDRLIYCYEYSRLLAAALEYDSEGESKKRLLQAILGFGSIGILNRDGIVTAGAIHTGIHPVYQTVRIRNGTTPHDPKYLPLITTFDPFSEPARSLLCYYYRQIPILECRHKLFAYPAVDKQYRFESFGDIHRLMQTLSAKKDALVKNRAEFLAEKVFAPAIRKMQEQGTVFSNSNPLKIADLGGGGGDLVRCMIDSLTRKYPNLLPSCSIAWTIVEVEGMDYRRYRNNNRLLYSLRSFQYEPSDYIRWIETQPEDDHSYHFVLMCRLLNNLSDFDVEFANDSISASKLFGTRFDPKKWYYGYHLPQKALASPGKGRDIIATNTRIPHRKGFTFRQPSLSDYFKGLYYLSNGELPDDARSRAVYYFVRKFCSDSLTLPDGSDALLKLSDLSRLIVIEDVDLDARMLERHFQLRDIDSLEYSELSNNAALGRGKVLQIWKKLHQDRSGCSSSNEDTISH